MTIKTCDKCGAKINTDPRSNAMLPMYTISRIDPYAVNLRSVDLCPKCEKRFVEWLNDKGGQDETD